MTDAILRTAISIFCVSITLHHVLIIPLATLFAPIGGIL